MGSESATARQWIGRVLLVLAVVSIGSVVAYSQISSARRAADEKRRDEDGLRMARFQDAIWDLEQIGDAGDEATRARCRHAVELLALLEPDKYQTLRFVRPAPEWLSAPAMPAK